MDSIWEEYGVAFDDNMYCLNDIVVKIIHSKNEDAYMKRIPAAIKVPMYGCNYVTEWDAMEIISDGKSVTSKEFIHQWVNLLMIITEIDEIDSSESESMDDIEVDETSESTSLIPVAPKTELSTSFSDTIKNNYIFEMYDNIYNFNSMNITILRHEQEIWFKGKEVATILGFENTNQAIRQHVDNDDKKSYLFFKSLIDKNGDILEISPKKINDIIDIADKKQIDPQTIFINQYGLFDLCMGCTLPTGKEFKRWIIREVLPQIFKYGTYSTNQANFDLSIQSVYNEVNISKYTGVNVFYIGYVGFHNNEHNFKYGFTIDIYRRDYKEHRKTYGENFTIIMIKETDSKEIVETAFSHELRVRHLHRTLTLEHKTKNGAKKVIHDELFTVNHLISIEQIKKIVEEIIIDNSSNLNKLKSTEITELKHQLEMKQLEIEKLQTIIEAKNKIINLQDKLIPK